MDDIAVIGVGLRFPGDATSPDGLWNVLDRGESQWTPFPKDRLNINGYYHPSGNRQGSISFLGAHFLREDVAAFDAPFFSVAAEDAKAIDPQQRLLLEVSYEAMENAGLRKEDLDGSDTAVYVGSFVKDYEQICLRDPDWQPQYAATGNGIAIMANRISYFFNFHGPSMTLDTGCSGSLVAVHLAAQSLRSGECSLAIAAGAGMILTPNTIMPMTALNFLSPDGKCFTFDSRANGYGRGEGVGVVILKRLSDAIRDNDHIRAVIRATSVNQDGRTTGITLPSKEAQVANITSVYKSAGLDFNQTAYVECHGTGTQAGDWRELKAISETLATVRNIKNPIYVGSVKPNIGHLEGAAGVAGLIKGILMLEKGCIPPNINFEVGNPDIDFENWKIKVPRKVTAWPLPGLRRVSVNCFGFGGTNAHVVLDQAPRRKSARTYKDNLSSSDEDIPVISVGDGSSSSEESSNSDGEISSWRLFCYSSNEKAGVQRTLAAHSAHLKERLDVQSTGFLANYSYTLNCRRSNLEWKGFVVAKSLLDLQGKLANFDIADVERSSIKRSPKVCFLFCGQGAQWAQMGKDLSGFPTFWYSLNAASWYLKTVLGSSFDLMDELMKDESQSQISQPAISQPATTVIQVALVELLTSLGIKPSVVVGHSSGEIAAAFAAGALTREAAWEIAFHRGYYASRISVKAPELQGAMLAVGMSANDARNYLETKQQSVDVACINSHNSVTLSGDRKMIEAIAEDLGSKSIFNRLLKVDVAYHSSHMRYVENEYRNALSFKPVSDNDNSVKQFSSVTGQVIEGKAMDASYWSQNMVSTVKYLDALQGVMALPSSEIPDIFVELSPSGVLKGPTSEILSNHPSFDRQTYISSMSRQRNSYATVLEAFGALWARGCSVDMENLVYRKSSRNHPLCLPNLPIFPWNHTKSHWHESHLSLANRFREFGRQDLIGAPTADSVSFEPRWRGFLRLSENPWLQDHQVQKTIVYPAAGMISMVLEAARQVKFEKQDATGFEIQNMQIEKAMVIPQSSHGLEVALNLKKTCTEVQEKSGFDQFEFTLYCKPLDMEWSRHANGTLLIHTEPQGMHHSQQFAADHSTAKDMCTKSHDPRQLYEHLDTMGISYGPTFRNITEIYATHDSCLSKVRVPDTKSRMPSKFEYPHLIHPATLDSMFQTLFAIEPIPRLPTFIKRLYISADLSPSQPDEFEGHAIARPTSLRDVTASISMRKSNSPTSLVLISGFVLTRFDLTSASHSGGFIPSYQSLCTEIVWKQDLRSSSSVSLTELVALKAHKTPALSILQIGGHATLSLSILSSTISQSRVNPHLVRYTIIDPLNQPIAKQVIDVVKDTAFAELVERVQSVSDLLLTYDVVISCQDANISEDALTSHMKRDGIAFYEQDSSSNGPQKDDISGHQNMERKAVSWSSSNTQSQVQKYFGSSIKDALLSTPNPNTCFLYNELSQANSELSSSKIVFLAPESYDSELQELMSLVEKTSRDKSPNSQFSTLNVEEILTNPSLVRGKHIVWLLELMPQLLINSAFGWDEKTFDAFHSMYRQAKGILCLTRGSHMVSFNPKGAAILGLARTLMSEDPRKIVATFDLSVEASLSDPTTGKLITRVLHDTFVSQPEPEPRETQYAEKHGQIYIPRLDLLSDLNSVIEKGTEIVEDIMKPFLGKSDAGNDTGVRLDIEAEGPRYVEYRRFNPKSNEIELIFKSTTLISDDAIVASGKSSRKHLGMDIVGEIKSVGSGVQDFYPGQTVSALVPIGSTIQDISCHRVDLVTKYTPGYIPSLYISGFYGLVSKGAGAPGKVLLVHAGASAYGQAVIRIAEAIGIETWATTVGPDTVDQFKILTKLGLPGDKIIDANFDNICSTILAGTENRGVDILYDTSLELWGEDYSCLRPCGTLVRVAKPLTHQKSIRLPEGSVTIAVIDIQTVFSHDTALVANIFKDVTQLFAVQSSLLSFPEPLGVYNLDDIEGALNSVSRYPNQGYITLGHDPNKDMIRVYRKKVTNNLSTFLRDDATYILVGGLSGLGLSIAELLVSSGAKHLVFLSRSSNPPEQTIARISEWAKCGVEVKTFSVDICKRQDLDTIITNTIAKEMPKIHGVFHCAAVIKDSTFENMTYTDWKTALNPKTIGAFNTVESITTTAPSAFHIFLSSSAGVIGNRGQGNYAAGNAFLDALSSYCRVHGGQAVSIDLGPILGAGMLTQDEDKLNSLLASGFYGIRHEDFLTIIKHAIMMEVFPKVEMPHQVILGVGSGGLILQNQPADPYWSRTALYSYMNLVDMPASALNQAAVGAKNDFKSRLASFSEIEPAKAAVSEGLCSMLAKSMSMTQEEVDSSQPPNAYGVDSLIAVGIRNWVLTNCEVEISVFEILSDCTIAELAGIIVDRTFAIEEENIDD